MGKYAHIVIYTCVFVLLDALLSRIFLLIACSEALFIQSFGYTK